MNKLHIEKNTVQETLIIPLYGRKMCSERFPELYQDELAKELCQRLDYDFSSLEKKKASFFYEFGALEAAMRQLDMMWELKAYLKQHPKATIVNLGCGLDQTGKTCDNGQCRIVNIDFPKIIEVRNRLIPLSENERNIAMDLKDERWMDEIDGSQGVFFFAAGVFHYFQKEEVKTLLHKMSLKFPGGVLVFDTVGKKGLKLMLSKTLKKMGIKDVGGYFYVENLKEIQWFSTTEVSSKGYMLGYYDMKVPSIGFLHRFLAKIGDDIFKMAIIKMQFKKGSSSTYQ